MPKIIDGSTKLSNPNTQRAFERIMLKLEGTSDSGIPYDMLPDVIEQARTGVLGTARHTPRVQNFHDHQHAVFIGRTEDVDQCWCSRGHFAPMSEFSADKSRKNGIQRYCREHFTEYRRERRRKERETIWNDGKHIVAAIGRIEKKAA